MRKARKVGVYLDYLHKGAVCTCMAATLYGASFIGFRTYQYYTNVKPQLQIQRDAENRKLLAEGSSETAVGDTATL